MSARRCRAAFGLLIVVAACASCRRGSSASSGSPLPSAAASTSGLAKSVAKKSMTPEEEAAFQGHKPEEVPLVLGPAPGRASVAEREQRLKELLSGQTPVERLPLVAVARDVGYDSDLYDSLTTELDTRPPVDVTLHVGTATLLSGALEQVLADRLTSAMRGSLRNCFRRALEQNEDAPSTTKIDVVLLVNADGTVESAAVEGKQDPGLSQFFYCLKARASAARFDPAPGRQSRLRFSVDATGTRKR